MNTVGVETKGKLASFFSANHLPFQEIALASNGRQDVQEKQVAVARGHLTKSSTCLGNDKSTSYCCYPLRFFN